MRHVLTLLHRWLGLAMAGFLIVAGLTGAVISWDHELDGLLNPHLTEAVAEGPAIPSLELAAAIEQRDPQGWVTYVPLNAEPGHSLGFGVSPRVDPATGRLHELGYNEVFVDPATGRELGRREWGAAWPITTENLVSFLYVLHYSLHVPELWGIELWGVWLMGIVALAWTIDCFVGFYLTLPNRLAADPGRPEAVRRRLARGWWSRWKPAWQIKTSGSAYRINFDIHRAFSLWTWALLLILAFTSFSMNLYSEIFHPLMSKISEVTPTPFDLRRPADHDRPILPLVDYPVVIERAVAEARGRGWDQPAGDIYYSPEYGIYGVGFFHPGDDHGAAGVGPPYLFYDGVDGRFLGGQLPWHGTAADIFVQAQFPLHSGRILGLPGRILVSLMGIVVAALAVTGIVVWARKRRARLLAEKRRGSRPAVAGPRSSMSAAARRRPRIVPAASVERLGRSFPDKDWN